jgi:hypothetical protein
MVIKANSYEDSGWYKAYLEWKELPPTARNPWILYPSVTTTISTSGTPIATSPAKYTYNRSHVSPGSGGPWEPYVYQRPKLLQELKVRDRGLELAGYLFRANRCCDPCGKFYGGRMPRPGSQRYLGVCDLCENIGDGVRDLSDWGLLLDCKLALTRPK